jgi:crotonobetainyl-CoA:carnitine CoA-transferase CaiB-like acyl-CoA transferase
MSGPLSGCRVLDLGIITAGAATSALLADLGAEVIKIESPRYRDPFRGWTSGKPDTVGAGPPFFRATNRNKTGLSLDLKQPEGRAAFLRLVAKSDVVVENFRRGALTGLGLDFPVLREANPAVILASISSQGETGPDARYVSFGSTLEAMGGLAWQTGYRDGRPVISGRDLNYPDQVVAIFAAGMVVTAWLNRSRENGVHLDLSQRELTSFLLGDMFPAAGQAGVRQGNAETGYAVQECFRTADPAWLALSVTEAQAPAFDAIIGLSDPAARLDRAAGWIAERTLAACLDVLTGAGLAVAPVLDGGDVLRDQGGRWQTAMLTLPGGVLVKGFPFQLDGQPLAVHRDSPAIGAHSRAVLMEVGGFSPEEIAGLVESGAVEVAKA